MSPKRKRAQKGLLLGILESDLQEEKRCSLADFKTSEPLPKTKLLAYLPIVSIVVPFFWFSQFYIQDPKG